MEGLKKGPWSKEEDQILLDYVKNYGAEKWNSIQEKGLLRRNGKSCYFRWKNKLRPDVKQTKLSDDEKNLILELQSKLGNKWAKIATFLEGRTDNDVKNFWNSLQKQTARQTERAPFGDILNNFNNNENTSGAGCSVCHPIQNTDQEETVMAAQELTSDQNQKDGCSETSQNKNEGCSETP